MNIYDKQGNSKRLNVTTSTLPNWYPLDINYDVMYDERGLYLHQFPGEDTMLNSYGTEPRVPIDREHWLCPRVKADNHRVEEIAKCNDIKTWRDNYTQSDIDEGFMMLGMLIDLATKQSIDEYKLNQSLRNNILLAKMNIDNQHTTGLTNASPIINKEMQDYGKIYVMLMLMRKAHTAGDRGLSE